MSRDVAQYVFRNPRYVIAEGQQTVVDLRRESEPIGLPVVAELIDFSRKGMQVSTDLELTVGEEITATLRDPGRKVELGLGGHVQWQRRIDQRFAVGIQFTAEVSWEIMGELFIRGILDQDSAV